MHQVLWGPYDRWSQISHWDNPLFKRVHQCTYLLWQMKSSHMPLPVFTTLYTEMMGSIISMTSHPLRNCSTLDVAADLMDVSVFYPSSVIVQEKTSIRPLSSHFLSTLNCCTITQTNKNEFRIRFRVRRNVVVFRCAPFFCVVTTTNFDIYHACSREIICSISTIQGVFAQYLYHPSCSHKTIITVILPNYKL